MKLTGTYDVTVVGNAIVDIFAHTQEAFLTAHKLEKGTMKLVTRRESDALVKVIDTIKRQSGGSGANTAAGLASMGGKCAFIGKVAQDELGDVFRQDMEAIGVDFRTPPADANAEESTALCLSMITPDAERTMATYLGISTEIEPTDLDETKIRNSKITYLEGYLFDKPMAKEAFYAAAHMAHTAGKMVALSLSDPFCVERHRADFQELVSGHVDILFCNEKELLNLYDTNDFNAALARVSEHTEFCAVTRGPKGAEIMFNGTSFKIPAPYIANMADLTGAGDLFAAGVLYGLTQGKDPVECGRLGSLAAAEIISQVGARPERSLKLLLAA